MVLPPSTMRPRRKFCVDGARDAHGVDAEMGVEARVLGGDDRVAQASAGIWERGTKMRRSTWNSVMSSSLSS